MKKKKIETITLETPLQAIKGVGPSLYEKLSTGGNATLKDALFFFPKHYENTEVIRAPDRLESGVLRRYAVTVSGKISYFSNTMGLKVLLADKPVYLRWFNVKRGMYAAFSKAFEPQKEVVIRGSAYEKEGKWFIAHPAIVPKSETDEAMPYIPRYPAIEGISETRLTQIISAAVTAALPLLAAPTTDAVIVRYNLPPLSTALSAIHFPNPPHGENLDNYLAPYHRRIFIEELIPLQTEILRRRLKNASLSAPKITATDEEVMSRVESALSFALTPEQLRVTGEILSDMRSGHPMRRLLQGDVGSGKTAVAVSAIIAVVRSGCQVALMAPTEVLAEQHFSYFTRAIGNLVRMRLLTGSVKKSGRALIIGECQDGVVDLVIGTHSLISPEVEFKNLGLVIIDEQHRFGVRERAKLPEKGTSPHLLVMTATPIPRTLAMAVYGDLDMSVIEKRLPHQKPIKTIVAKREKLGDVYKALKKCAEENGQAFYVVPKIGKEKSPEGDLLESETSGKKELVNIKDTLERLGKELSDLRMAVLHSEIPAFERDIIVERFRKKRIDVLIATTIIEVGVDIPSATLMVIDNADRFGLSQLHQLRGRVGRAEKEGTCIALYSEPLTESGVARLSAFSRINDGFELASADLEIRGQGELWGTKQSGFIMPMGLGLVEQAELVALARNISAEQLGAELMASAKLEHLI